MTSSETINSIFEKITEVYQDPVPIGGRCESSVYYRVEDLSEEDLNVCAEYVANRIKNVISPLRLNLIFKLPGGYSFFAERLCAVYTEYYAKQDIIRLENFSDKKFTQEFAELNKGKNAILVTDVITTARSSLEAHTKATLKGIQVVSWATLIDRTFGPGPVPVVSAYTGEAVRLLSMIG
jgi:hypoxanthine-guanine phosphoribosyltransferase